MYVVGRIRPVKMKGGESCEGGGGGGRTQNGNGCGRCQGFPPPDNMLEKVLMEMRSQKKKKEKGK